MVFSQGFLEMIDKRDANLFERAKNTLFGNIIEAPSEKMEDFVFGSYRGISPSPRTYQGVWNWDGAFHLIGMSYFDKEIAHDQMRILFDFQKVNGQIADVVYTTGECVFKFTKPPVLAWSIMKSDMIVEDKEFLQYSYPYLLKNLEWWEKERFDGTLFRYKISKMESGWDNTVRFDFPNKIDNCYAVDCNCFMIDFYKSMEYISEKIGKSEDTLSFRQRREKLAKKINEILWSKENNYYCDYNASRGRLTNRLSPASFMPLFCGIASNEQAQSMKKLAESKDYFYPGIPTISYNNKKYNSKKYWRGPCWLNTAYFAIRGLFDYGYKELASQLTENILGWCDQNKDSIYEYYDSKTGQGLGAKDFGWSSVFIIELILLKNGGNII